MKIKITNEDRKWSKQVRERDGYQCQYPECQNGGKFTNAHHIFPRARRNTRHDLLNGITLCAWHHTFGPDSAHKAPEAFRKLMKKHLGKNYMKLQDKSLGVIR